MTRAQHLRAGRPHPRIGRAGSGSPRRGGRAGSRAGRPLQEFLKPVLHLILAPLQGCDLGPCRFQDPLLLHLRCGDLSLPIQLLELIADHLELGIEELSTGRIVRRIELRFEVFLCPRKFRAQKALILVLTLAGEQVPDLIPHLGEAAPVNSEGARGLTLRHREFLHMGKHIATLCLDLRESVLEALQRLGPHR